jgi:hypothetical protein
MIGIQIVDLSIEELVILVVVALVAVLLAIFA